VNTPDFQIFFGVPFCPGFSANAGAFPSGAKTSLQALTWWRPLGTHLAKPEGRWVLVVSPARALCSSSCYRNSGASIFQSHKTTSNTASGGPSHHAKISHGGCGFHSGLGRTLRARISIPSLQDGFEARCLSFNSTCRYFVPIRLFAAAPRRPASSVWHGNLLVP